MEYMNQISSKMKNFELEMEYFFHFLGWKHTFLKKKKN